MENKTMTAVNIVYIAICDKYYISHKESGQNAFGNDVNGFYEMADAIKFAESNGCEVFETRLSTRY